MSGRRVCCRTGLAREEGVALPVAMLTLLVIGILTSMIAVTAIETSDNSNVNRRSAVALAAANAGVQAAVARLNALGAQSSQWFTNQGVTASPGSYPSWSDSIGNGSIYTYYVTPVLTQTDPCSGLFVNGPGGQPVVQRCVVSTGSYRGISRRVEQRIVAYEPSGAVFPVNGMLGLSSIRFTGNGSFTGDIGSNGNISLTGADNVTGKGEYGPNGSISHCSGSCVPTPEPTPFSLPPVDPTPFQQSAQAGGNNNSQLPWPPGAYNSTTRVLSTSASIGTSSNPVSIPAGTYNFCELDLSGTNYLQLAAGARVVIYVDSPYRTGSGCPAGSGNASFGTMHLTNVSQDPNALQIIVYGDPSGAAGGSPNSSITLDQSGSTPLYTTVYAPNSDVTLDKFITMTGQLVGYTISGGTQTTFTAGGGGNGGSQTSAPVPYYPAGWHECPAKPSGADPRSGC